MQNTDVAVAHEQQLRRLIAQFDRRAQAAITYPRVFPPTGLPKRAAKSREWLAGGTRERARRVRQAARIAHMKALRSAPECEG